jgi:hypothetical protein
MAVNPNIALSFRPTVGLETPGNMMQQVMQVRGMEQQNQLRAMQMEAAQREQAQGNQLADYMRSGVQDPQELLRFGPQGVAAYQAMLRGRAEERLGRAADVRLDTEQLARSRNLLSMVRDPQSYQAWRADAIERMPSLANMIPAEYDPRAVEQMALTADQIIEKNRTQIVPGGGAAVRDGRVIFENPRQEQRTPTRQDYEFARSPEGGGFTGTYMDFLAARSARPAPARAAGGGGAGGGSNVPPQGRPILTGPLAGNRLMPDGSLEPMVGAPPTRGAAATETREAGMSQLAAVAQEMKDVYARLDDLGAMVRSGENPAQNLVARVRASGPGQMAEGGIGTLAQEERDVLKSLRLQLVLAIQRATGAAASALNSDRELSTWLDSVTSPSQSRGATEKILDNFQNVVETMRMRHSDAAPQRASGTIRPPAAGGAPPAPARPNLDALLDQYAPRR